MAKRWDEFDDHWDLPGRQKRNRWIAWVVVAVVCYGLGIATGSLGMPRVVSNDQIVGNSTPPNLPGVNNALPPSLNSSLITQIYQLARPSVVTITAVSRDSSSKNNSTQEAVGTGFFIDTQGDIATNNHVVDGQKTVSVAIGDKTVQGTVVGTDAMDDLAIIHVSPVEGVRPLSLGTAKTLQPGELLVAIGNPFELTDSVSAGIVSGLNRSMSTSSGREMSGLVQTDAALNPGNSGGPLLNAQGQVVGINTAIESPVAGSVGIGFAIPIDRLEELIPKLLTGAKVDHPWIGITALPITPGVVEEYNLPVKSGILVISTVKDGPAYKAGIHGDSTPNADTPTGDGDIITAVDGQAVNDVAALTAYVSAKDVGSKVTLTILRKGKPMEVPLTLQAWPDSTQ